MNTQGTDEGSVTVGLPDLQTTRQMLIATRFDHGADTPIGHRCSNIVELLQVPELPTALIKRQMDDLQRLLQGSSR